MCAFDPVSRRAGGSGAFGFSAERRGGLPAPGRRQPGRPSLHGLGVLPCTAALTRSPQTLRDLRGL